MEMKKFNPKDHRRMIDYQKKRTIDRQNAEADFQDSWKISTEIVLRLVCIL